MSSWRQARWGVTTEKVQAFATAIVLVAVAGIVFAEVARALNDFEQPTLGMTIAGGAAAVAVLWLALVRLDWAVGLGVLLLGIVRFEPAPTDVVLGIAIAVALVTSRVALQQVPPVVFALAGAFLVLNIVSTVEAVDPMRALVFFSITAYLLALAVWLTNYVRSEGTAKFIARCYVWGAAIVTIPTLAAIFFAVPGSDLLTYDGTARKVSKDPNVFGPFLVPAILILLEDVLHPHVVTRRRFVAAILALLLTCGVVFAYSRAGWLNLALGVLTMLAVIHVSAWWRRARASPPDRHPHRCRCRHDGLGRLRVVELLRGTRSSPRIRLRQVRRQGSGLEIASSHPFGIGPGQFERFSETGAHSLYVRTLAEQGVLGAATMIALMFATLVLAARNAIQGGVRMESGAPRSWPHGSGSSRTVRSWTRCTGGISGSSPL